MLAIIGAMPTFTPASTTSFVPTHAQQAATTLTMRTDDTFAPAGMGKEYVSQPRKPLAEYAGASLELDLASYFKDGTAAAWDPMSFSELYKVSGNNPDAAFLREAELKHGRIAMLAFAGILATNGGVHLPGEVWLDADWTSAWSSVAAKNPSATTQIIFGIAAVEGSTSKGVFDLWFGITDKREPGDIGFDPLNLMPKTPAAAEKMKTKELKNGRLAMIAVMGFASNHFIPGSVPGIQGFLP
jgi:hypothetical protein